MYRIIRSRFGRFRKIQLLDARSGDRLQCVPEHGGCIYNLRLRTSKTLLSVLDGFTSDTELLSDTDFKSAKLLPFANRIAFTDSSTK
jgi:hypothetical protein